MEIGMAAKEYLIEIEVRKYTPKMIRSYRNNLNPTISGKMLHKLKNGLHKAVGFHSEHHRFSISANLYVIRDSVVTNATLFGSSHNSGMKKPTSSPRPPAAHSRRRRPLPDPGGRSGWSPAVPRWPDA